MHFPYLSCVQVLPYSVGGHAVQCTHAEVSVMSVFWPSHWRDVFMITFLPILPPLTPSHYRVISESTAVNICLGTFFLISHWSNTHRHKNNAAISHTQTHRSVCWRQEHGVLSTHTHTHTYTSTCMLLPFQTTGCWGNRSAPPFFLIKAIRASAFISTTTAGATICFYYRFASFNLFLPCDRNTLSKKHTWARIYFPFPMLKCLYVCIWVAACVCVCVANGVVKLVRERAEQRAVLTIGTTCTPLWEPPESCQSINI